MSAYIIKIAAKLITRYTRPRAKKHPPPPPEIGLKETQDIFVCSSNTNKHLIGNLVCRQHLKRSAYNNRTSTTFLSIRSTNDAGQVYQRTPMHSFLLNAPSATNGSHIWTQQKVSRLDFHRKFVKHHWGFMWAGLIAIYLTYQPDILLIGLEEEAYRQILKVPYRGKVFAQIMPFMQIKSNQNSMKCT